MPTENQALPFTPPYDALRQNNYPLIGDQLGLLYDDVRDGKFGEPAKTGTWYLAIKAVRDEFPKPAPEPAPAPTPAP